MAILDEIRSLSSDRIAENLADALQMRVEWAYEYAENCNLPEVLLAIGSYNWYGAFSSSFFKLFRISNKNKMKNFKPFR
jgi:hypothetical protein